MSSTVAGRESPLRSTFTGWPIRKLRALYSAANPPASRSTQILWNCCKNDAAIRLLTAAVRPSREELRSLYGPPDPEEAGEDF